MVPAKSVAPVVSPDAIPLRLAGVRDSLPYGDTLRLSITADTIAADISKARVVVWSSSDTLTARVDSTGLVTAVGMGPVTVSATRGTRSGNVQIKSYFAEFGRGRRYTAVSGSEYATCALTAEGAAFCMGGNQFGQLGTTAELEPCATAGTCAYDFVPVDGGRRYQSIERSFPHTCALEVGGQLYCWGGNGSGQLGQGVLAPTRSPVPLLAAGGTRFLTFAAAGHAQTCGSRAADSVVMCWGHNDYLQSGRFPSASADPRVLPVDSVGPLVQVSTDSFHSCGLTPAGQAFCWGAGGSTGASAVYPGNRTTPVAVQTSARFAQITTGPNATCGLTATGEAICWGQSDFIDLSGFGLLPRSPFPSLRFAVISLGDTQFCGITADGRAYCTAPLTIAARNAPESALVPIAPSLRFQAIDVNGVGPAVCAITLDGALYCWGPGLLERPAV